MARKTRGGGALDATLWPDVTAGAPRRMAPPGAARRAPIFSALSALGAALFSLVLAACNATVISNTDGSCTPGTTQPCYDGPADTQGVGACAGGMQTCDSTGMWGPCAGQVLPTWERCSNKIDDNCNGRVDEIVDLDGDGFTNCDGDCCDSLEDGCNSPKLVNPGAFEVAGNRFDDNCDGTADNTAATCDSGLASGSGDPLDFARAIDLCQTATLTDRKWGVIEAKFVKADGTGAPDAKQHAIRTAFGGTTVQGGASFAVLSTGHAAALGQTDPGFASFQTGVSLKSFSGFPADWLQANKNTLPNAPNCPAINPRTTANDPIMLQWKIRVPTNAQGFRLSTNFFSAEYPEFVCSPYNDFFVVLLDSTYAGTPANPADKNLATYTAPNKQVFPVGVNLASGNTGLFRICDNSVTGCSPEAIAGNNNLCTGTAELTGTGMDIVQTDFCTVRRKVGGGTGWLITRGNVVSGEIITLRIAIWDTSDGVLDSVSLIDNFQWLPQAGEAGTIIG